MSGSREKRLRKSPSVKPTSAALTQKQLDEKKKDRMYKIASISIVVVLIVAIILALFQNVFAAKTPAAIIGGEKVYPYEVNYYYYNSYINAYENLQQSFGEYASYFLDPSSSLKSQPYPYAEDTTWHDYLLDTALTTVQQVHALCDKAAVEGVTLTEANAEAVQEEYDSVYEYVVTENEGDMDYYLSYVYGNGMTDEEYKRILNDTYLASQYSNDVGESFTFEPSAISDYYNEHRNDFDKVDYRYFYFSAGITSDMSEAESNSALASANSLAEIMANSVTSEESFVNLAYQYADEDSKETYEDENATLSTGVTYSSAGSAVTSAGAEWLFDTERVPGDVSIFDSSAGSYVVMYVDRYREEYNTVNVRHILIQAEVSEDADEPTAEQQEAAKEEAEAILAEWEAGDKTEDSFAQLAIEKSQDPGSASNGGLYENVYQGQMVEQFDDWCFNDNRKPGDYDIVQTDYGYHIMYFVSEGMPYWELQVENVLRTNKYNEWITEVTANYEIKRRVLGLMSVRLPG